MNKGEEYVIQYLVDNYKVMKNKEIAKHLGCSIEDFYRLLTKYDILKRQEDALLNKKFQEKLERIRNGSVEGKKQYIKDNLKMKTPIEIANDLNMSESMVIHYSQVMGISKSKLKHKEVVTYVLKHHKRFNITEMARRKNVSWHYVKKVLNELGVEATKQQYKGSSNKFTGSKSKELETAN